MRHLHEIPEREMSKPSLIPHLKAHRALLKWGSLTLHP
jgi:hypothetical protein